MIADELLLVVRSNTSQAMAGLTAVEGKIKSVGAVAAGLSSAGAALTKGLTAPIIGLGAASLKAFANFDQAMTESLAIMTNVTEEQQKRMRESARAVAKETTLSATEAARAYFFLASAGLDAEQSIAALPQVAKFAQAGAFDMATATDLATDAQSALGLTVDDSAKNLENLTRVTDVFVRANTLANATVEEFSSAMTTKAGAAARTLGMEIEETTAILAVMADAGIKGQRAGTQLAMMLNNLTTNAVKNEKAFKKYNITVFDSQGEMRNMADIVEDMSVAFGGMSDKAKVAAIANLGFGDRAANTLKVLMDSQDAMRDYQAELEDASGFTEQVAAKQLESFTAQMSLLGSKLTDIGIVIGSALAPRIIELVDAISPTIEKIGEWIEENTDLALKIAGLAAGIGPVLFAMGKMVTVIGLLTSPVGLLVAAIGAAAFVMKEMGITMEDVLNWIQPVIDVLQTLGQWFMFTVDSGDPLNDFLADLPGPIKDFMEAAIGLWEQVGPIFEDLKVVAMSIWEAFQEAWPLIQETVTTVLETIMGAAEDFRDDVLPPFMELFTALKEFVLEVVTSFQENWDKIEEIVSRGVEIVSGIFQDLMDFAVPLIRDMVEFITDLIEKLTEWWDENFPLILATVEKVLGMVETIWNIVWPAIAEVLQVTWDIMKAVVEGALDVIMGLITTVMAIFTGDWEAAWEGIKQIFSGVWTALSGIVLNAWAAVTAVWNLIWATFRAGWELAWGVLGEAVQGAFDGVIWIFKTSINGILSGLEWGINKAIDALNDAIDAADVLAGPFINFPDNAVKHISIPRLGFGGDVVSPGFIKVGDRGMPEIMHVPEGASVRPASGMPGGGGTLIGELHVHEGGDAISIAREVGWELTKMGRA